MAERLEHGRREALLRGGVIPLISTKHIARLNDSRSEQPWSVTVAIRCGGEVIASIARSGRIPVGATIFVPVTAPQPSIADGSKPGKIALEASIGGVHLNDRFTFHVFAAPKPMTSQVPVFVPRGTTTAMRLRQLPGRRFRRSRQRHGPRRRRSPGGEPVLSRLSRQLCAGRRSIPILPLVTRRSRTSRPPGQESGRLRSSLDPSYIDNPGEAWHKPL